MDAVEVHGVGHLAQVVVRHWDPSRSYMGKRLPSGLKEMRCLWSNQSANCTIAAPFLARPAMCSITWSVGKLSGPCKK